MSEQSATYSNYRGMNSFKVITGVAPNAVISYVSGLYPGSVSDKSIVQESELLTHFVPGDLILADNLRENVPEDRVKSRKCGTCLKN